MTEFYAGEAALRRALHAAAEQVDPAGDGLDRIRERVRHRRPMPLPIAWVDIALTRLSLRVPDGFWVAWDRMAHEVRSVAQHFLPAPARGRPARSERTWLGWARPVAAMSTAIFIVAAVIYTAVEVPQVISPIAGSQSSLRTSGQHRPTGGNTGPGGQPEARPGSSQSIFPVPTAGATNSSACAKTKPTPLRTITGQPPSPTSTSTSPSSTPSPTPTSTSPSSTPSPTPTPTGTETSSPTGLGSSPSDVSLAPADPSAGTSGGQPNTASNTTEHSGSALRTTGGARARTATAAPKATATPCPTSKPSPTSTVKVHPDSIGQLGLWTGGAALAPADERARIS